MTRNLASTIQQSIAANKFYPPRINKSQSIARHSIIAGKIDSDDISKQVIVVEAQAGQGKTTLVHQYLEHVKKPFIWYQIGTEDADPVVLLTALKLALSRNIKNFSSPQLEAILEKGQVGPMDLHGCANILLNDIDSALKEDIFLVLDDLHLISEAQLTNQLLDYLIDTSPPTFRFILTSRHPLKLGAQAIRKNPLLIYLDSNDLALGLAEIESLYHNVLKTEINRYEAEQILEVTNGWIMGIVLAAHPLAGGKKTIQSKNVIHKKHTLLSQDNDSFILSFFKDEIFSQIPDTLHEPFIKLAFLDEIDVQFAETLTGIDDIGEQLENMADLNFFVYRLDDKNQMYRFHHLFQEFLQTLGRHTLSSEIIAAIYRRAANYYLERDLIEKALKALRNGEDFQTMEHVLQKHGLQLVSANHTVTILGILETIPEEILLARGWLAFFHALLTTDFNPQRTLPHFEASIIKFTENKEEAGELMALSQIIYFHFVISGRYNDGSKLLERTRVLFESVRNDLPPEISIIVVRNLAAGYCFFDGKMDAARHYAQMGCDLAIKRDSKNFLAASRFILGYIGLLSGDRRRAKMEIEKSYPLVSDQLVGMSNRLTLHVMQLCELSMQGSFPAFLYHKDLVSEGVDPEIVRQTVAAPYLYVWSAIGLIAHGKRSEALDVIEQGMFISKTALSSHMSSQLFQWRAFIHALNGDTQEALSDIDQATEMRMNSGGPFFTGYHFAVKGATLAQLADYKSARGYLDQAVNIAEEIDSPYIKTCALAYLCFIDIHEKKRSPAEKLRELFELMYEAGYDYFWGWEPEIVLQLLCAAVKLGIEPDFAKKLAEQRLGFAITPAGEPMPMLMIKVLGKFSINLSGEELFGPKDLSAHQRELFGLLISSPDLQISQDQVQFALWPDSPPDKASKTFYTLISRLRKALAAKLEDPTKYIRVEKSYIQLTNVIVDAGHFLNLARLGIKLGKQEQWWQAGNAFTGALYCWDNFSSLDIFLSDQAIMFTDEIHDMLRRICLDWGTALSKLNRIDEALALLEKAGKILMTDEDSVSLQYQLYIKNKNPLKARSLLDNYYQELLRLGYNEDEAAEMRDLMIKSEFN